MKVRITAVDIAFIAGIVALVVGLIIGQTVIAIGGAAVVGAALALTAVNMLKRNKKSD